MSDKLRFYVTEQISENIAETPEGYLLCRDVPITRIGEFLYKDGEVPVTADKYGVIRIKRVEDEVFNDVAIKSFEAKPITINHPDGFVDPSNWSELAVGTTQNVRRGEGYQKDLLLADLLITTKEAIELVKEGLREISCGYDAQYEQEEKGIGKQTEIIGNHVALVMKGRAGSRCKINDKKTCDSCGECKCKNNDKQEDKKMKFKDVFLKWLDACPVKDEDIEETEEEKAARLEKEAKDKKSKDEDEDLEKKEKEVKDKKSKDDEEEQEIATLQQLSERIANLESIIDALVASDKEVHEAMDKKFKDEEETKEDEKKEKEIEEKETADCEAQWPNIVHRAEVLSPGISLTKPTKDHAKRLKKIKAEVLKSASMNSQTKDAVAAFADFGGKSFDELSAIALDAAFLGASELVAQLNNRKVQLSTINTKKFSVASDVNLINQKNKEFYKTT